MLIFVSLSLPALYIISPPNLKAAQKNKSSCFSLGLTWGSPSSAHPGMCIHQRSRSRFAGVTEGSPVLALTGCGLHQAEAQREPGQRQLFGKSEPDGSVYRRIMHQHILSEGVIFLPSLSHATNAFPQVGTALSV